MKTTLHIASALLLSAPLHGTLFLRQTGDGARLYAGILTLPQDFPSDDCFAAVATGPDGSVTIAPLESDPLPEHYQGGDVTWLLRESIWAQDGCRAFVRDTGHSTEEGKLVIICGAGRTSPFSGSECLVDFTRGHPAAPRPAPSAGLQPGTLLTEPLFQSARGRIGVGTSVHLLVAHLFDQHHAALIEGNEREWLASLHPSSRLHVTPMREPTFERYLKALASNGDLTQASELVTPESKAKRTLAAKRAITDALLPVDA